MNPENFISKINQKVDAAPSSDSDNEEEAKKERYLNLLPSELAERWSDASSEKIQQIVMKREMLGHGKVIGYHVSDKDIPIEWGIEPGLNGTVEYSDNLENLYGKHGGGFIYVIEGRKDDEVTDPAFGWRVIRTKENDRIKIINKIPITPEAMRDLGANFADCEYH